MLVKIWLYLTKSVITGDVDEVRVQSEEPYLRSLLRKLSRLFAFRYLPAPSTVHHALQDRLARNDNFISSPRGL